MIIQGLSMSTSNYKPRLIINPKKQFGGMKEGKPAKEKKNLQKNYKLDTFFLRPPPTTASPSTSPLPKKKTTSHSKQTPATNNKQRPISPPSQSFTYPLSYCLRNYSFQALLNECPILRQVIQSLSKNLKVQLPLVKRVVCAYLKGGEHALWSDKYAPKSIQQLFDQSIGCQLRTWITSSFAYRNTMKNDPQFQGSSFINDMVSEEFSCSLHQTMADRQWKCQALVLVGREGIGKMAAIRAVTLQMGVQIMKCSNQFNQIKYLREKHQSTKSENVKGSLKKQLSIYMKDTKQTKVPAKDTSKSKNIGKNLKDMMSSRNITGYFTPVLQSQASPVPSIHSKKIHLFHHPTQIYPQSDRNKFMNQLHSSLTTSKIPFILTCLPPLPPQLAKYDIIQFPDDDGKAQTQIKFKSKLKKDTKEITMREEICRWMLVISHVERWRIIGKANKIGKDGVIKEIDRLISQMRQKKSQQESALGPTYHQMQRIYTIYNGNIPKIMTFLQFYLPNHPHPDYSQLSSEYLSTRKAHDLLYSMIKPIIKPKPMIKETPTEQVPKTQDTVVQIDENKQENQQKVIEEVQQREELEVLSDVIRKCELEVLYDVLPQGNGLLQCMRIRKNQQSIVIQPAHNVPVGEHVAAKCHLAHLLKNLMKEQFQASCTLRPSELCYLPMLIRGRRSSRKDKQAITLSQMLRGSKAMHQGQIQYLINNTHFI